MEVAIEFTTGSSEIGPTVGASCRCFTSKPYLGIPLGSTFFLKENCGGHPHSASFFMYKLGLVQVREDTYIEREEGGEKESYNEESQETTESFITLLNRTR